ncbi:hypothetical protein L218DRAFT_233139 [Marasmius fiardii PR-910]|nr:hypothetical protein L218DRAFT_233139 [Marasmius fiardii PR-910]
MGNFRYIPPAVKHEMYTFSTRVKTGQVAEAYGVSKRTVQRVKERVEKARVYEEMNGEWAKQTGRPRVLDSFDLAFLEGCIERTPDLELSELFCVGEVLLGNRSHLYLLKGMRKKEQSI